MMGRVFLGSVFVICLLSGGFSDKAFGDQKERSSTTFTTGGASIQSLGNRPQETTGRHQLKTRFVPPPTLLKLAANQQLGHGLRTLGFRMDGPSESRLLKTHIDIKQRSALQRLVQTSLDPVYAYFNERNGTPSFLRGNFRSASPPRSLDRSKRSYADVARRFLTENRTLLKLDDPQAELHLRRETVDSLQMKHLRFQQLLNGVPIWGREVAVHLDVNDTVYLFQGHYEPTERDFDVTPGLSPEQATRVVHEDLDLSQDAITESAPELMVYMTAGGQPVLAYQVDITPVIDQRWIYFVNAHTGIVEHRIFNIHSAVVSARGRDLLGVERSFRAWSQDGAYYMIDPTTPVNDPPFNPLEDQKSSGDTVILDARNGDGSALYHSTSSSQSDGWDPTAVSALHNTHVVYDYFSTFGRRSFDDKNGNLLAVIHLGTELRECILERHDDGLWGRRPNLCAACALSGCRRA